GGESSQCLLLRFRLHIYDPVAGNPVRTKRVTLHRWHGTEACSLGFSLRKIYRVGFADQTESCRFYSGLLHQGVTSLLRAEITVKNTADAFPGARRFSPMPASAAANRHR